MRFLMMSVSLMLVGVASAQDRPKEPKKQQQQLLAKLDVKKDVVYAQAGDIDLKLDVYSPKESRSELRPCIVWIHGGGWQSGDKASGFSRLGRFLASGDYVGVSVGYRLTDKASWPAQIHDCKAAVRYLRANAKELGIDHEKIGLWGSSAGGHLVSLLGTSSDAPELEGELGVTGISSHVACVVDFCGPSDFLRFSQDNPRESSPGNAVYKLFGGPISEKADTARQASPIHYVSKNDPPFLIVHGTDDKTVPLDQAVAFHTAQEKAGMDTTLVKIEGGGHGIGGPEIEETVREFFAKHLQ